MSKITDKLEVLRGSETETDLCFADLTRGCVIDFVVDGRTTIYKRTLEETRQEYPHAEMMTFAAFQSWKASQQNAPVEWSETTEADYYRMLECLPPAAMIGGGFLVGEAYDHCVLSGLPRFQAFKRRCGKCWKASRPMTLATFRHLMATT